MATTHGIGCALGLTNAERLAETFVDLAHGVTDGFDVVDLLSMLAERTTELLPVAACGLLVIDAAGDLRMISTSSYEAGVLDLYQIQNAEGPCRECCTTGEPVSDTVLDLDGPWFRFAQLARSFGFTAVYAIPLGARGVTVGALNLFTESHLRQEHLAVAQALADAASMAILQSDPHLDLAVISRQLFDALESRNAIEQARGVLAERYSVSPDEALLRLRRVADELGFGLSQLSALVVQRAEPAEVSELLKVAGEER